MSGGRKSDVFMEIFRILCLEFAFAVLLAFIVCLVGRLLFMVVGCFLAVVNRVCLGWLVRNEGGFRLVVPRKGSDESPILFCVFGAGTASCNEICVDYFGWVVQSENANRSVRVQSLI